MTLGAVRKHQRCHLPSLSEGNPLMLPGLTVPGSLAVLLQAFRSCFRLRPFEVFCLLTVGMITRHCCIPRERSPVARLLA